MNKKNQSWIIVKDKKTYAYLLAIPIGIIKIIVYDFASLPNVSAFVFNIFISIMIMLVGLYFFVRFNSYSNLMNPSHPKPKAKK